LGNNGEKGREGRREKKVHIGKPQRNWTEKEVPVPSSVVEAQPNVSIIIEVSEFKRRE
jgi:hypothetical protein